MSKSLKIGVNQVRSTIKELVRQKWIKRTDVIGVGIKLEATINNADPLTDKTRVSLRRSISPPLTDQLGVPLTDQLDKGYTSKDIQKGKVISIDRGSKKTNKNNEGATEYGW